MFPRLHHMYIQCQLILNRIIYNITLAPGPWLLVIGSCRVLAMTLLALSLAPACMVLGSWSLAHAPWSLACWSKSQMDAVSRLGLSWPMGGCRAVYIATSPRKWARRRGSRWDSKFLMILYIYIHIYIYKQIASLTHTFLNSKKIYIY